MGEIGVREEQLSEEKVQILQRMGHENLGSDYKAYEADWLLALEITKPMDIVFKNLEVAIKCWQVFLFEKKKN